MPRSKAQYKAPLTFAEVVTDHLRTGLDPKKPRDFSEVLHGRLRMIYAKAVLKKDAVSVCPGKRQCRECRFADEVLSEAHFVFTELDYQRSATNKGDTKAEQENLTKRLRASINKIKRTPNAARDDSGLVDLARDLRRISLDLDKLLPVGADPRGCATILDGYGSGVASAEAAIKALDLMHAQVTEAGKGLRMIPEKLKDNEVHHYIAVWLAESVLPVLERNGIATSDYASDRRGRGTNAVNVLKAIGDGVGICFEPSTWRNVISEAKTPKTG